MKTRGSCWVGSPMEPTINSKKNPRTPGKSLDQDKLLRISLSDRDLQVPQYPLQPAARRPVDAVAEQQPDLWRTHAS